MYPDWGVGFEDATMKGLVSAGYALISHPPSMAITPSTVTILVMMFFILSLGPFHCTTGGASLLSVQSIKLEIKAVSSS